MKAGLTRAQADLLAFIRDYIGLNDCSPSYDEMMVGIDQHSKSSVHRLVCSLEERGHIRRVPGRARSIEMAEQPQFPHELEQRIGAYCRTIGIPRATFDQRAAECLLRGGRP